jgi:peroxiredoxin Q/BCP
VIGVSADPQDESDRFRETLCLPFPLVGDSQGRVLRAYGVRWPLLGLARRVSFLIGRDRRIRMALHDELRVTEHVRRAEEALAGGA